MTKFTKTLSEAKEEGFFIIDIRRSDECAAKPNPYADEEIEMTVLLASPDDFLPDQNILLVCAAGVRAEKTAAYLEGLGYEKIFYYPSAW